MNTQSCTDWKKQFALGLLEGAPTLGSVENIDIEPFAPRDVDIPAYVVTLRGLSFPASFNIRCIRGAVKKGIQFRVTGNDDGRVDHMAIETSFSPHHFTNPWKVFGKDIGTRFVGRYLNREKPCDYNANLAKQHADGI